MTTERTSKLLQQQTWLVSFRSRTTWALSWRDGTSWCHAMRMPSCTQSEGVGLHPVTDKSLSINAVVVW